MARGGAGGVPDQVARRPQRQTVPVPARGKIAENVLPVLVRKAFQHPQHRVAPQAAEGAYPNRYAAVSQTFGQNDTLRRDHLLTVQAGGRGVQQQIHRKGGAVLLLRAQKHPVVVQVRGAPHPPGAQITAACHPLVWLLMHQNTVADLLGKAQYNTSMQLLIFCVVGAVAFGLQFGLLRQLPRFRGGRLRRAGHTGAEPQMTAQMHSGAQLLLGLVQLFRRVEAAPEAAFNVGAVLRGALLQGNVCPALVHRQPAAGGIHRTGMLHRHPVGLDHLGGHGFGGKFCPKALQPQMQRGLLAYLAVKQGKLCKQRQQVAFELCWFRYGLRFQRGGKAALVRGHDRGGASQHPAPAGSLHGVHQLVLRHPLLPRKLVLDGKKVVRVGKPQRFQHRAAGQLQPVGCVF